MGTKIILSRCGIFGELLSDSEKSLRGVNLLVTTIGHDSPATVLCHNSNFLKPYHDDPETTTEALIDLADAIGSDNAGPVLCKSVNFLKPYHDDPDTTMKALRELLQYYGNDQKKCRIALTGATGRHIPFMEQYYQQINSGSDKAFDFESMQKAVIFPKGLVSSGRNSGPNSASKVNQITWAPLIPSSRLQPCTSW